MSSVFRVCAAALVASVAVGGNPALPVGGAREADISSDLVVEAAQRAAFHYNAVSNAATVHNLVRVTHATSQVVAGVKYTIDMELGPTHCTHSEVAAPADLSACEADASQAFAVRAVVVRQAWQAAKHPEKEWSVSFVDVPEHTGA